MSLGKVSIAIEAQMASFESDMGRAARVAEKELKKIERDAKKTEERMREIGRAIGVAVAAGATAAAVALKGTINAMDDLSKAAQKAQMPTEEFSRLAYAGSLADVSLQDLTGAMGKLAKAQGDAQRSTSTQARVFEGLGIATKNVDGSLRNTSEILMEFADRFQELNGSPEILAAGMNIFGRSFQTLIPLLKDGSAGLRAAGEEADALGVTLSTEAGAQAEAFNDNLTRLTTSAKGFAQAVVTELLPDMVKLTDEFASNAQQGATAAEVADDIRYAIEAVGLVVGPVVTIFQQLGKIVEGATMRFIGLKEAAMGVVTMDWARVRAGMRVEQEAARLLFDGATNASDPASPAGPAAPAGFTPSMAPKAWRDELSVAQEVAATKAARERRAAIARALGDPEASGGGGGGSRSKSPVVTQAEKDAKELEEVYAEIEAMTARFITDKIISDGKLADQEAEQAARREENAQRVIDAIEFEKTQLGLSAEAQEVWNNLRWAGVEADSAFGASIIKSTEELARQREQVNDQIEAMDGLRDSARGFLDDLREGKGVWDSLKAAADNFADVLFKIAADGLIDQLFGKQGSTQGGSIGGGFDWGGLIGSFFGGGRASGGPVSGGSFYEVGEMNRPELFASGGRTFLIPGNDGAVMPMSGGGGTQIKQQFVVQGRMDRRTSEQMARASGNEARRAMARTGR